MTPGVDTRDVIDRAEDIARTFVCAGCDTPVSLRDRFGLHPAPVALPAVAPAVGELGAGRSTAGPSTGSLSVRKGDDAPDGFSLRRRVAALSAACAVRLASSIFGGAR